MNVILINLMVMIVVGIVGAAGRIFVQRWSSKTWPHETLSGFIVALALGALGGYLAWELPHYIEWAYFGRLGALVMGYFCGDILENILEGFKPPIG